MYKDMLLKLEYHRSKILQAFIKQGYFPTKDEVSSKLSQIDERIALFKSYNFEPGENFNAKEMNHCLKMLYNDLLFLYKIIEEIYTEKYNSLLLNVEIHMNYLEGLATHFKKRGDEEIKGTSLGKTLFFKSDSWESSIKDETMEVKIGDIELVQGTEISCFANINNADKKNILFKFESEDDAKSFTAFPYNYNNDTYIVPGDITVNEKEFKLQEQFNINSEIVLPVKVNMDNDYKIVGGNNKIIVTDKLTNEIKVYDFPTVEKPFVAPSNCYISFYIENKGTIEYSFSNKPLHCNFSVQDGLIQTTKDVQKIFLDVEKGFNCYFTLNEDSKAWACYEEGIKDNNKLIYDGLLLVRDFKIKEYVRDKKTVYNVKLKINEVDNDEVIDCVYIKEVS